MSHRTDAHPYVLSHRAHNAEEWTRLNQQHLAIKHAILEGHLTHPSVVLPRNDLAIADLGCGTGVWLDDMARTLLTSDRVQNDKLPTLVGFDVNPLAFSECPVPGVSLVHHDCTTPFDHQWIGAFDLVVIRGLALAIPSDKFQNLITNAIQLLKPGGYLEWLETETQLFQPIPTTQEFQKAFELIMVDRERRGLVTDLPSFMFAQFQTRFQDRGMTLVEFELRRGGFSRDGSHITSPLDVDVKLSDIMLESVKLLLEASALGRSQGTEDMTMSVSEMEPDLIKMVECARQSGDIRMGGIFPHLIARKQI